MGQGLRLIIPQTPIWVESPTTVPQQYPASQNLCKLVGIANLVHRLVLHSSPQLLKRISVFHIRIKLGWV